MNNHGFIRTAAAVPAIRIADTTYNTEQILSAAEMAFKAEVSLIVFPELSITGFTCGDLFTQSHLLKGAENGVSRLLDFSRGKSMTMVIGAPISFHGRLYDCGIIIRNGNIKGIVPKTYTGKGDVFSSASDLMTSTPSGFGSMLCNGKDTIREGFCSEIRYAGQRCNISPNMLFEIGSAVFSVEIGNDVMSPAPPSGYHSMAGAQIIANPSADCESLMSDSRRADALSVLSSRTHTAHIYASAGSGESSTDFVYGGHASVWEDGRLICRNERFQTDGSMIIADIDIERIDMARRKSDNFTIIGPDGRKGTDYHSCYSRISLGEAFDTDFEQELYRPVEAHPFAPEGEMDTRCKEILDIQTAGLVTRLAHIRCNTAVIGISGGLDSTLALLVTVMAFDRSGWSRDRIIGVTMPGYGTTSRTKNNATDLMDALGITSREISITAACDQHFKDLGHDKDVHDVTYENSQARERTQILMDIANQTNGIVIGTGDLSELALGWATYNGDHMSMYAVNAGVPKTLVRSLVEWAAQNKFSDVREILLDIADTPISPELLPANAEGRIEQVTEDLVGPYELHDFFIYNFMKNGYSPEKIYFLARKAFAGRYDNPTIEKWLKTFIRRFFNQQFKRSCLPDGPAVGSVSLSPRKGWDMPSDAWSRIFIETL